MSRHKKKQNVPQEEVLEPTKVTLPVLPPQEEAKASCKSCKHYQELNGEMGRCVRYPPVVAMAGLVLTSDGPLGIFPITLQNNICGEFSPHDPVS